MSDDFDIDLDGEIENDVELDAVDEVDYENSQELDALDEVSCESGEILENIDEDDYGNVMELNELDDVQFEGEFDNLLSESDELGEDSIEELSELEIDDLEPLELEEIEEPPKVYTRDITPEIIESRERDTEEVLDNYRENLREYGIDDEKIESFIDGEREKIHSEYESLDRGDTASNTYYMPTDWEELSETLQSDTNGNPTMIDSDIDMAPEESSEEIDSETQEFEDAEQNELKDAENSDEFEINTTLEFEDKGEIEEGIGYTDVENEEIEDYEDEQEELENLSREDNNLDIVKPAEINADINESIDTNYAESEVGNKGGEDLYEESQDLDTPIEIMSEDMIADDEVSDSLENLPDINYDEIYDEIQQESLQEGFEDFPIDTDSERLYDSLENFDKSTWENLSLDEQKDSMKNLADYIVDVVGYDTPPDIKYYNNNQNGDYGGYDADTNTLRINEYMLYNSEEAADTIAHELWHAHQHERAMNPRCARDYQYQYNFENYIPPELGQEAYENQLVEAEARAFAAQFKDKLVPVNGGFHDERNY